MKPQLFIRISEIAAQLEAEGKTPSLALVRGRLDLPVSQAELFSTYQQWRNQGSPRSSATPTSVQPTTDNTAPATQYLPAELKADLARIEAKLDLLLQKLAEPR